MSKISRFILFLSVFLMPFFSYGQREDFLSDLQALEQSSSEVLSLESSENVSNSAGESVLSVKGEGLISVPLFFSQVTPVAPVLSIEFQTPFKEKGNLKWLVQAGGGITVHSQELKKTEAGHRKILVKFYVSAEAGLRYDFQPWAASLTLGGYVTPQTFSGSDEWAVHPVLAHIKWTLSVERKFTNVYVGLTGGSFATIYTPFLGLSVRFPFKTW